MLAKRIIPCLDVKAGKVVKGIQFRNHKIMGDMIDLAALYSESGADELVFYDITASSDARSVSRDWVKRVAQQINIPFSVAGGIRSLTDAEAVLNAGADKISINSPALENPELINQMAERFGSQCVVIGIDSYQHHQQYQVYQYTGDVSKLQATKRNTITWAQEVQARGAGEIVLNCMNHDGVRTGYDIAQLTTMREVLTIPLIASGGAGQLSHFAEVFQQANVDGALAASVFHSGEITIAELKQSLSQQGIIVRC